MEMNRGTRQRFLQKLPNRHKKTEALSIPHAGEIAPTPGKGPESVEKAIDILSASRIQHGVLAIQDEVLIEKIKEKIYA